ncbi:MAG TPA: GNAT family N-acetyltransferase [Pseudonocardia sp.]|nr:GNAT family N-acetyltransferase [Pseudonocardia sp.]
MHTPGEAADRLDALVGRRVALRHRLPEVDGRPMLTDAVGELGEDGPGAVLVHTRRGVVRVARDAVVAVREIPPPMPRRPSWAAVARLERICSDAWPAVLTRPLGQWRLRAAGGFTGRANSALAVGDPGLAMPVALDRVCGFAAEHGLLPRVQVAMGSPWQRAILAHGWTRDDDHPAGADVAVLVAELPLVAAPTDPAPTDPTVTDPTVTDPAATDPGPTGSGPAGAATGSRTEPTGLLGTEPVSSDTAQLTGWLEPPAPVDGVELTIDEEPAADWWRLTADPPVSDAQRHVLTAPGLGHVGFGLARDDSGAAVGVARLAVVDGHLHVARLTVAEPFRRRGLGVALMRAAAQWGMTRAGAQWCVLQVAQHNEPALALYRQLGFRVHHRYQYLRPAGPAETRT